jgi:hypothetical protein
MSSRSVSSLLRRRGLHAALGVALAASLSTAAPTAVATAAPDPECDPATGHSSARALDPHKHGEDFNSVTAAEAARFQALIDRRVGKADDKRATAKDGRITIRTFVHVITKRDGSGAPTPQQIRQQMGVINKAYAGESALSSAPTRFRFKVVDTDYTRNNAWYDWNLTPDGEDEDAEAKAAKRALHRGGKSALNVYIAGLGSGLLGYATFPWEGGPKLDGLVILNESMPGGAAAPYNHGDTATHEIGHWLGLFHTFENGCTRPGDYIGDTPYQADGPNIFYCGGNPEFGADTCPQPGVDPVHNFMSYGDDACLNRFSPDQARRQELVWRLFRAGR